MKIEIIINLATIISNNDIMVIKKMKEILSDIQEYFSLKYKDNKRDLKNYEKKIKDNHNDIFLEILGDSLYFTENKKYICNVDYKEYNEVVLEVVKDLCNSKNYKFSFNSITQENIDEMYTNEFLNLLQLNLRNNNVILGFIDEDTDSYTLLILQESEIELVSEMCIQLGCKLRFDFIE